MNKEKLYEYYEKSFSHIKPEGKQITSIEEIRTSYKQLLADLMECCPQSNNLLESLKLLENSLMYAVKSIVMNEEEKEPESKNISGETFTEGKYTCDMCYKETDTITDIPGSQFKHGICNNCLDIVREFVEKGGII